MKPAFPIEGKAFRFAPARGREVVASFWKVWSEKNEVYLANRSMGGSRHISVHESGAIHHRMGMKQKQDLAPLKRLSSGSWHHAVELRFLTSERSLPPKSELKSLGRKKAYVLPVPDGFALHVNLLVSDAMPESDLELPTEFMPAAHLLWRSRLRNGRIAALIGRVLLQSEENTAHVRFIRSELKPTATLSRPDPSARMEVHHLHWSQSGGNVVLIVPMGSDAFRSDDEGSDPEKANPTRRFSVEADGSEQAILAPDGRPVVAIRIDAFNGSLDLTKGQPKEVVLGHIQIELVSGNLLLGNRFFAAPVAIPHALRIGGASPGAWAYSVAARFDGSQMIVEFRQLSVGLRNKNLEVAVRGLAEDEELTLTAPKSSTQYVLNLSDTRVSVPLVGKLCLRTQR